ncbi:hypothetical protein Hanom_Chr03g00190971 [Helianthus anomalus]
MMPSERDTAFPLRDGKVTLLADFFKFCSLRLPISKFCKSMFYEYAVHISQMHPIGLSKLRHFEYAVLSLAPFCNFDRRSTDEACLRFVPSSCRDKGWKKKFFFIDVDVIPGKMHWRVMAAKEKVKDIVPPKAKYVENALFKGLFPDPLSV